MRIRSEARFLAIPATDSMTLADRFNLQGGKSLSWQVAGLLLAWLYVVGLHWANDGLWYQGDSPRHAANGLFWWDFLSSFPVNPKEFALSYYARYPVIHPTAYPPVFYLLEGFAFSLFGASPYLAKSLVSVFSVVAGVYIIAWLRRWVAPEAGWGGLLLILQPGLIMWSNAVMLNVPAMAMGCAALYHTRRWLESAGTRHHAYLAGFFAVIGILTYFPTGVVVPIILVWIVADGHWRTFLDRRKWVIFVLSIALLLPSALLVKQWAPAHFANLTAPFRTGWYAHRWSYYFDHIDEIIYPLLLFLALLGLVLMIGTRSWRKEVRFLLIWTGVCLGAFSYMWFKEARYVLLVVFPVIIFAVTGILCLSRWCSAILRRPTGALFFPLLSLVVALHVLMAPNVTFPQIEGFERVVAFLEQVSPQGRFFYDGRYDGVFSFYLRSRDPNFERGVVLGDKLLYTTRFLKGEKAEYVHSPSDVVDILRTKCGCQWLVIEKRGASEWIAAARHLRDALAGKEFQRVKSFPIRGPQPTRVDVYRFLPSVTATEQLELRFPRVGSEAKFKASPLTR